MNGPMLPHEEVMQAAARITQLHAELQRLAEVRAYNKAIDKASEIIADWLAHGRDESTLFDRLQDAKVWTA